MFFTKDFNMTTKGGNGVYFYINLTATGVHKLLFVYVQSMK
jgi:hypothetical protein